MWIRISRSQVQFEPFIIIYLLPSKVNLQLSVMPFEHLVLDQRLNHRVKGVPDLTDQQRLPRLYTILRYLFEFLLAKAGLIESLLFG
jgi:hypothetical protein